MNIPLYTGPAAQAARRALGWRRVALRSVRRDRIDADLHESANQFRMARMLSEGGR